MGCCASRPSGDGTPAVRAHSSSRNITAPSTRSSSPHASQGNLHPSHSRQDPDDRPNTPLKSIAAAQRSRLPSSLSSPTAKRVRPLTDSTNLAWTRSRLEKERKDWWDTQVTGSEEIWGAIRLAAQHLQAGQLQEAQTMLDVTDCTCPTGRLWRGVYDPTGVQYKVPEWIVVEPEGLAEDQDESAATGLVEASRYDTHEQLSTDDDRGEVLPVRVRTSHNQRDARLSVGKKETVASIVGNIKKQAKINPTHNVRLAYGGRLYQDHETLESHPHWNYANDYVLSALVTTNA
ncbi:hypothetical protein ACN47E_005142 [Coniothyrium glycines]